MTPGMWIHGFVFLTLILYIIYASGELPKIVRTIFLVIFAATIGALLFSTIYYPDIVIELGDKLKDMF